MREECDQLNRCFSIILLLKDIRGNEVCHDTDGKIATKQEHQNGSPEKLHEKEVQHMRHQYMGMHGMVLELCLQMIRC